jgi:hypothetical protein
MRFYHKLVSEVANLKRTISQLAIPATVDEVKGDKMRCVIGKDKNGQSVYSCWMTASMIRGGARQSQFYKKGQNVILFNHTGDQRGPSLILPGPPGMKNLWPDHYDGKDGKETYQLDNHREVVTKKGRTMWLQEPKQQQQQGEAKKLPEYESDADAEKASMVARMDEKGGHTLRVGKTVRVASHSQGAKIKNSKNYCLTLGDKTVVRSESGQAYIAAKKTLYAEGNPPTVNMPWVISEEKVPSDTIPDDNEVMEKEQQQSQQQGSGSQST